MAVVSAILLLSLLPALGRVGPASGETAGALAPPFSGAGIDTNGDRLFNFLQITVPVQVTVGGRFTVDVILNDSLDLATLARASASPALGPGLQQVQILLDGADIYNGGVPGPYDAHITLSSDYRNILSRGTFITAAYSNTDFQPYDARFVPPSSEGTLDNDSDGLIDWVSLTFTLDIATAGNYTLSSYMTDTGNTLSVRWSQTALLTPGKYSLRQLFLAYPFRLAFKSGPYLTANSLFDWRGILDDFAFVQTASYNYTKLEGAPVTFSGTPTEKAEDTDGDGLYNDLRFTIPLLVDNAGTYTLRAHLYTSGGKQLQGSVYGLAMVPGPQTVQVYFAGASIYAGATNGPYRLDLELYDADVRKLDTLTYWTGAYPYTAFQPRVLSLAPPHADQGVDYDGDGLFDALRLLIYVNVTVTSQVTFSAGIYNPSGGPDLARATKTTYLPAGFQVVALDFPGAALLASGVDGPYRMWITVVDAQGNILDQGGHRSLAYSLSQFEARAHGTLQAIDRETLEDPDGNGRYNRLRIRVDINTSAPGTYQVLASLTRGTTVVTSATTVANLTAGNTAVDLVFAGPDIRSMGLDGPYYLRSTLSWVSSPTAMDSVIFLTSTYLASSFDGYPLVTVSGRITSANLGTPLGGATVWLLDYTNYVSRQATADAQGYYSLQVYAGTYQVTVDHPSGQALSAPKSFASNTPLNFTLPLPLRSRVLDSLVWTGWDRVAVTVRYVYSSDSARLRYDLDWNLGNRDGFVEAWEGRWLVQAQDPLRGGLDGGKTGGLMTINGVAYAATGPAFWTDNLVGPVGSATVPFLQVSRSFASNLSLGKPQTVSLAYTTSYDTGSMDHSTTFLFPGAYGYASFSDNPSVSYFGRAFPCVLDPDVDPLGRDPPGSTFVQISLGLGVGYTAPTPGAPAQPSWSTAYGSTDLTWTKVSYNTDGSRVANLAGYNVYFSPTPSGTFGRVNPVLLTTEGFGMVLGPGTYYYRITAVNTDGVEGSPSPITVVTVGP